MKKQKRLICLILSFALLLLPLAENSTVYGSETTSSESTDGTDTDSSADTADTADTTGTDDSEDADSPTDISSATVTLSKTSYVYNGEKRTPSVTVVLDGTTLKKNRDYTVTYGKNKSIGTAAVKITGTGDYTGTVRTHFKIIPGTVKIKSLKSTTTKKLTVRWKKLSGSVKYQIAYRQKGTKTWKKKNVSSDTLAKTISGLKANKTYYVKIRAYKKVSGTTYRDEWSDTESVKVKAEKIVYLTFDDGPAANMGKVLDILEDYNVKATFFVGGRNTKYRYLITKAYKQGHAIGLHSYTHDYAKIYKSESAFYKDLNKISDVVYDLTGERSYLLRFPGGSSNTVSRRYKKGIMTTLTKSVEKKGYTYFDWNVSSGDASGSNVPVSTIVKNSTSSSAKEINLLMHCSASKNTTVKALPKIIKYYKKKGYSFEVLTEDAYTAHHHINN